MNITVVVACDESWGIGQDGGLPWNLPGDMKHFKETTTGEGGGVNAVLMGKNTWFSIPQKFRPLKERRNIVLSRTLNSLDGAELATSAAEAMQKAEGCEQVYCIGGAKLYADMIVRPECDSLIITHVESSVECDVYFPDPRKDFCVAETLGSGSDEGINYVIKRWQRKAP